MAQLTKDERPKPLTSREVADLFNVSTVTVASWADEGKLPYFRTPGGHRRFHRADVEAALEMGAPDSEPAVSR